MKNFSTKIFSALIASFMLTAGVSTMTSSAESAKAGEKVTAVTQSAKTGSSKTTAGKPTKSNTENYKDKVVDALKSGKGIQNTSKDFSEDENCDTKGNATLIKSQQIIFDSDKMQFISVTTKDGHVFYVLINYSASQGEDNVFFLNKVDDMDLYALLYETDDDSSKMTPEEAKQAAEKAVGNTTDDSESEKSDTSKTDSQAQADTKKTTASNTSSMYMLLGIFAVAGIGGIGFVLMRKKGKKNTNPEPEISEDENNVFDDDFDDFDNDDE